MALKRPPQNRVDAEPVYVDEKDDAWDNARIKEECRKMRQDGLDPSRHPVNVYHSGASRYDLGAAYAIPGGVASASNYLGPDATRFNLKRLSLAEVYRLTDLGASTAMGRLYACRIGVLGLEGEGPKLKRDDYGLTEESLEALFALRADLPAKLGLAVYLASQPLTDDEKKA